MRHAEVGEADGVAEGEDTARVVISQTPGTKRVVPYSELTVTAVRNENGEARHERMEMIGEPREAGLIAQSKRCPIRYISISVV